MNSSFWRESSHRSLQLLCQSWSQSRTWQMFESARNSLKQLGIFFKYSPMRRHLFGDCVEQYNATLPQNKKATKKKMFCEKRRVEKKHFTWRLPEDVWANSTKSWKHYINRWSGWQQCYSGVDNFKINSKLHFHRCF